jgi:hypothetical protein
MVGCNFEFLIINFKCFIIKNSNYEVPIQNLKLRI